MMRKASRSLRSNHLSLPLSAPPADVLARESLLLAPYAFPSGASRGRKFAEHRPAAQGPFAEDRDRIIRSSAFRRLSGKLQVFTGDRGEYHRTRLTHTMEVAVLARTLARKLRLNEDLVEALALVHDLGHPPFGHAGEEVLHELALEDGGFNHNRHGLRVVERFEQIGISAPGLNLSWEVLEGQKTRTLRDAPVGSPLLEAQVVEAADSVAYDTHDADDALALGLVTLDELLQLPLWKQAARRVRARSGALSQDELRGAVLQELLDWQSADLFQTTSAMLEESGVRSPQEVREAFPLVRPSPEIAAWKHELECFLFERVYRSPNLEAMRRRARCILEGAFAVVSARPDWLPPRFQPTIEQPSRRLAVVEYLACQTDRSVQSLDPPRSDEEAFLATPYPDPARDGR